MKVFLDTGPVLLLAEGSGEQSMAIRAQMDNWLRSGAEFGCSVLTLSELLIYPKLISDLTLQYRYRALLGEIVSFPFFNIDDQVANLAADFIAEFGLRPLISLQYGAAVLHEFEVFYTSESSPEGFSQLEVVTC